jgi:hypothetical protein
MEDPAHQLGLVIARSAATWRSACTTAWIAAPDNRAPNDSLAMRTSAWMLALFALVLLTTAGCQSTTNAPANGFLVNKSKSVEITPGDEEFMQRRSVASSQIRKTSRTTAVEMTESDIYDLPKFTVARKGFRKLGLSVVTNTEVALAGTIEWMRVGVVLPGLPAARQGLFTGIEILAIDNVPVAQLSREEMLHLLFEREAGEQVRLLVYSQQFGPLPRFVTL